MCYLLLTDINYDLLIFCRSEERVNADLLFPSDDEAPRPRVEKKQRRKHSPEASTSRATPAHSPTPKKKKPVFKPISTKRTSARDLFGTDSEEEDVVPSNSGKRPTPLVSYITRRLANGHSRQVFDEKPGTHFIDLRIYKCDEIEKVQPMNRWRHSIVCVKNRTDETSEAWQHLANFMIATRKEYRCCPPTFISNYY